MTNARSTPRPPAYLPAHLRRQWRAIAADLDPVGGELAAQFVLAADAAADAGRRVAVEGVTARSVRGLPRVSDAARDLTRATRDLLRAHRALFGNRRDS